MQKDVEILLENNCRNINLQRGVWIGLEKSIFGCNVPWMWTSGTEVEYDEWNNSSHIDPVNNHCGKIVWVNGTNYKWQDAHCFEKLPFICQGKLFCFVQVQIWHKTMMCFNIQV